MADEINIVSNDKNIPMFYGSNGTVTNDEYNALLKEVYNTYTNTTQYFIKVSSGPYNRNFPYNVIEPDGRNKYIFRKVSKDCYDLYMLYVKTKRDSYLRGAFRKI